MCLNIRKTIWPSPCIIVFTFIYLFSCTWESGGAQVRHIENSVTKMRVRKNVIKAGVFGPKPGPHSITSHVFVFWNRMWLFPCMVYVFFAYPLNSLAFCLPGSSGRSRNLRNLINLIFSIFMIFHDFWHFLHKLQFSCVLLWFRSCAALGAQMPKCRAARQAKHKHMHMFCLFGSSRLSELEKIVEIAQIQHFLIILTRYLRPASKT